MKEIRRPEFTDAEGDPAFPIIKTGRTTDDTVGRLNGTTARRLLDVGGELITVTEIVAFEAMEGRGGYFSQPGDSGSACADAKNRLVGWVTGGSGVNPRTDKSYIYPSCHFFECKLPEIVRMKALPGSEKWTMALPVGEVSTRGSHSLSISFTHAYKDRSLDIHGMMTLKDDTIFIYSSSIFNLKIMTLC